MLVIVGIGKLVQKLKHRICILFMNVNGSLLVSYSLKNQVNNSLVIFLS